MKKRNTVIFSVALPTAHEDLVGIVERCALLNSISIRFKSISPDNCGGNVGPMSRSQPIPMAISHNLSCLTNALAQLR